MKKLEILIIGLLFNQIIIGQIPFSKGSVIVGEGFDAGWNMANVRFQPLPDNVSQTYSFKLRSSNFNLSGEYGLCNFIGIGLIGKIDNYYINGNQFIKIPPSAADEEAGAMINIHFVSVPHFDLIAGIDAGFSHFAYNVNDETGTIINGDGKWDDIRASGRWCLGKVAISLSVFASTNNYGNLQSNQAPEGEYLVNSFKTMGYGAGIGVQYQLF